MLLKTNDGFGFRWQMGNMKLRMREACAQSSPTIFYRIVSTATSRSARISLRGSSKHPEGLFVTLCFRT
jgi:hypothetical protein